MSMPNPSPANPDPQERRIGAAWYAGCYIFVSVLTGYGALHPVKLIPEAPLWIQLVFSLVTPSLTLFSALSGVIGIGHLIQYCALKARQED